MAIGQIEYYFSPASPWAYLGHERLKDIGQRYDLSIHVMPVDLAGTIFPQTGGAPPAERPLCRRLYRLVELERFSRHLSIQLNTQPAHFPVSSQLAAHMIVAVGLLHGQEAANRIAGAVMAAVWRDEKDISSEETLWEILRGSGLSADHLDLNHVDVTSTYERNTLCALHAGVFGSPSYVFAGELFFGQDRIEHLESAIVASGCESQSPS